MNFLVLGSGMMGGAIAFDLARSPDVDAVTLTDVDLELAQRTAAAIPGGRVRAVNLDVRDQTSVIALMREHECTVGAVSYRFNVALSEAAIAAGCHYCDLGGNDDVVTRQRALDKPAAERGVRIVPNCGLAPGLANILAARGAEEFDRVDRMMLRVGGLPQHPRPPLNYQLVFSAEGLVNEYSGRSVVLRDGKRESVDAMTEIEEIRFPEPFGTLEAFHTSGGVSLLPEMFEGKVGTLDYKTIRYPGHCEKFKTLLELGFASNEPVQMGTNIFTERELFFELLRRKLPDKGPDVVLVRVSLQGVKNNRKSSIEFEMIDYFNESDNISAMMRATGYPTSVIAQWVAREVSDFAGVRTPEQCVPLGPLLSGLEERGIRISKKLE